MPGNDSAVPQVCMGFILRHPLRIDPPPDPGEYKIKRRSPVFPRKRDEERIRRLSESSYTPTTQILLQKMDEDFRCSFLLSGVFIEHLEGADPDLHELLSQATAHRNAEVLSESYYNTAMGAIPDSDEFRIQVEMHRVLMTEFSGRKPSILVAPCRIFNRNIVKAALDEGFSAIYTDVFDTYHSAYDQFSGYTLDGIPLLIRHCKLSDDIATRYGDVDWEFHPLTARTYAGWIRGVGKCTVHILVDMEVFGGRYSRDTGIFEFLQALPGACADAGIRPVLPSEELKMITAADMFSDEQMEEVFGKWPQNMMQCTALDALRTAGRWVPDRTAWRRFQAMPLFQAMATTEGSCGMVKTQRSQAEAYQAFSRYMTALSRFEEEQSQMVRAGSAARFLRCIPPERAFHFCTPYHREGFSAHSLEEFVKLIDVASDDCIKHHGERSDIATWIREVIGDTTLAGRIQTLRGRNEIAEAVEKRIHELWNRLK